MMSDILYLAWRYIRYHRLKTVVLVASISIIVYLPMGLNILIDQSALQLTDRAASTPLLVGAKGSPLELALRSLYFAADEPAPIPYAEAIRVNESGLSTAIPLYTRFRTRYGPIVGTELSYFDFRGLQLVAGRPMALLGDCVIGSRLARESQLGVGDDLLSSGEDVFNLAGVYPLKMKIVGILAESSSPDDEAAFVDLKTAWIIEGLGHGHQDLSDEDASERVLRKDGNKVVANASVIQYNEITPENADSFHFHGDVSNFPITSIIAVPSDERASTLLQGRYLGSDEVVQIVRPDEVMQELLGTVFTVGRYVTFAVLIVALSTVATMALVFLLSLQLRRRELETMIKIGASRSRITAILATEILSVLCLGIGIAGLLGWSTSYLAGTAIRLLVQLS